MASVSVADSDEGLPVFAVRPVLAFMEKNQCELWQAARLLGGYASARLVDRCVELLECEGTLSSRSEMMLKQLLSLLSQDRNKTTNIPFDGPFLQIAPLDPVWGEIRELHNGLNAALDEFEARKFWSMPRPKRAKPGIRSPQIRIQEVGSQSRRR